MERLSCIVHYDITDSKYTNIKTISNINKEKIYAAKTFRKELGCANSHKEQCQNVPDEIRPGQTWYSCGSMLQKFVRILSDKLGAKVNQDAQMIYLAISHAQRGLNPWIPLMQEVCTPKECNYCIKYRVKKQQKHHIPITVSTLQAVNAIKQAAEGNENQSLFLK